MSDDLEDIPTAIPPHRLAAAVSAMGLPADTPLTVVDTSQALMLAVFMPVSDGVAGRVVGHVSPAWSVRLLRRLADETERSLCSCDLPDAGHALDCPMWISGGKP